MASSLVARVARQAASVARLSSSQPSTAQANSLVLCRGLAGAAVLMYSPPRVNAWQDPLSPSKWKEPGRACHGSCKFPSVTLKTIQVDGRQEMTL